MKQSQETVFFFSRKVTIILNHKAEWASFYILKVVPQIRDYSLVNFMYNENVKNSNLIKDIIQHSQNSTLANFLYTNSLKIISHSKSFFMNSLYL